MSVSKQKSTPPNPKAADVLTSHVLDSIAIPTFAINLDHEITHWNKALVKASGYSSDEMIGSTGQWKPFYPSKRPTMADLIVDGGNNKSVEKFYTDKYKQSNVLEYAYEAEDYFKGMGHGEWLAFTSAPITNTAGELIGAVETLVVISDRKKTELELIDSQQKYRELSTIDDLTQLFNTRHFYEEIHYEVDRCNRYEQRLTICMFDLDDFKSLNDNYGHLFGNTVLESFGKLIHASIRHIDAGYRYGGEEFIVIFPLINAQSASLVAERIRSELEKINFVTNSGQVVNVTVSAGIAEHKTNEQQESLIQRADRAMYQSKDNGKNLITVAK